MRAFIIGVVAMIIVASGAGFTLNSIEQSTGEKYSSGSTRLGDAGPAN
jgi:hypothetical protein